MTVKVTGSVRVDLVGGTLDLNPINLILKDVVTMNVATSLMAQVKLTKIDEDHIHFISKDYESENKFSLSSFTKENLNGDTFGPLKFLCQILDYFKVSTGIKIELESGSPAGAGLGGSSAMGVNFFAALCEFFDKNSIIPNIREIHLGGGSPSVMNAEEMGQLVKNLGKLVDYKSLDEFSLEIDTALLR